MIARETYGPDGRPLDGPRTTAAELAEQYRASSTLHVDPITFDNCASYQMWRGAAFLEGDLYSEALRGANAMRRHGTRRHFGIYRERARSAVLTAIMEGRERAIAHAEMLSNTGHGPHLVAAYDTGGTDWTRAHQDVIRYNDPTAPRAIHRAGDWDSRSAWQPYTTKG